jgi:hypothetical protein
MPDEKLVSSLLYTEATTKIKQEIKKELEKPDPPVEDGLLAISRNTEDEDDEKLPDVE